MLIRITVFAAVLLAFCMPAAAQQSQKASPGSDLRILDLQYLESSTTSRVVIRANLPFSYHAYYLDPNTLVIETDQADISGIAPGIRIGSRAIDSITVANRQSDTAGEVTAISIKYQPKQVYEITPKGRRLFIDFKPAVEKQSDSKTVAKAAAVKRNGGEPKATQETAPPAKRPVAAGEKVKDTQDALKYRMNPVVTYNLLDLRVDRDKTGTSIRILLDRQVEKRFYRVIPVGPPPRLVVDFHGARYLARSDKTEGDGSKFSSIRSAQFAVEPYPISRVVVDLSGSKKPRLVENGKELILLFSEQEQMAAAAEPPSSVEAKAKPQETAAKKEEKFGGESKSVAGQVEEQEKAGDNPTARQLIEEKLAEIRATGADKDNHAGDKESDEAESRPGETKTVATIPERQADETEVVTAPPKRRVEKESQKAYSRIPVKTDLPEKPEPERPAISDSPEKSEPEQKVSVDEKSTVKLVAIEDSGAETKAGSSPKVEQNSARNTVANKETQKPDAANNSLLVEKNIVDTPPLKQNASVSPDTDEAEPKPAAVMEPQVKKWTDPAPPAKLEDTAATASGKTEAKDSGSITQQEQFSENVDLFAEQYPDGLTAGSSALSGSVAAAPLRAQSQDTSQQERMLSTGDQEFFQTREITADEKRYRGHKVTLEFENISLRALVILLGQQTTKNFVVDPSVQPVTIGLSLRDLPWDQALDIILDHYGLGKIEEGNVIRIATIQRLTQETDERRKLAAQRALAVPLRQVTKPVNYAKAADLSNLIRRNLSSKGEVVVDARTNTLVITDIPSKVEEHLNLVATLDIPTKQVIVEARIVETTRDFINEFGLQYGFRASATREYGTSTGLIFPNQTTISGAGPALSPNLIPFAVNLPANTINSSLLGTFSNIRGSFILDAILTAAESERKVRVLSRPRISAQNNSKAVIKSGIEVPYQVIQNNTVSIRWREATLMLEVTPHITSDSTVILDLKVEKSSLGVQTAVGFTIQKRQATSTVLVKDGGVAVIGGVLEISDNLTIERTPFLSRIPIIGRLFRNRLQRIQNNELLIFISPKIIN